jgi:UDP-GlcNAc:undecaprenyl-phosphate GlcNAc-1-phosphate transferase
MNILFTFLLLFNFLFIKYFKNISRIINLFDLPNKKRKIHKKKVACIGGVLVFSNITIFFLFYLFNIISFKNNNLFLSKVDFINFYIFISLFFLIGLYDDKFYLNPNIKFFLFFILIYLLLKFNGELVLDNLTFSFYDKVINIHKISIIFTILCFLLFINAFNMFDGINLQSSLYSIFLFLVFIYKGIFVDISLVLIFSLIFFLYLNFRNKCFLGDNGTLMISFILGFLFIKSANTYNIFFADQIFLFMFLPGLDLLRLAVGRILDKKHPFEGDRNHIHHILIRKMGLEKTLLTTLGIIIAPNIFSFFSKNYVIPCVFLTFLLYIFIYFRHTK